MGLGLCCYSLDDDIRGDVLYKLTKHKHCIKGGTSKIYKIKIHQKFIVKKYKKQHKAFALNEITILKKLNNSHIHEYFPIFVKNDYHLGNYYLVMKDEHFYDAFSLFNSPRYISLPTTMSIFNQIINAVDSLHKFGYCHLDIKPENIILKKISRRKAKHLGIKTDYSYIKKALDYESNKHLDNYYQIKLIDFSGSKSFEQLKTIRPDSFISTYGYTAPEYYYDVEINEKFDVWSMGIILWEMIMNYAPFDSFSIQYIQEITNFGLFNPFKVNKTDLRKKPRKLVKILRQMIEPDPTLRISTDKLLENKVFYKILKKDLEIVV